MNPIFSNSTQVEEEVLLLTDIDKSWKVILWNDDVNTFNWVIECLVDICKHDIIQAEQCSMLVHFKGKCDVKSGSLTKMQSISQALTDRGLSATIEQTN
jgi:ATP-dependent Clp protease adaptor protein ClpS